MPTIRGPARSARRHRRHIVVGVCTALASLAVVLGGEAIALRDASARGGDAIGTYGWTYDPDTPSRPTRPIAVHVYITGSDGVRRFYDLTAHMSRPDAGAASAGTGNNHGFEAVVGDLPSGGVKIEVHPMGSADRPEDWQHLHHSNRGAEWVALR